MKQKRLIVAMLVAGMMILPVSAFAEMVKGTIDFVDKGSSSLSITRMDPATGSQEKLNITISKDVKFKGVTSLDELEPGQEVQIEAAQGPSGSLEAKSIKVVEATGQTGAGANVQAGANLSGDLGVGKKSSSSEEGQLPRNQ